MVDLRDVDVVLMHPQVEVVRGTKRLSKGARVQNEACGPHEVKRSRCVHMGENGTSSSGCQSAVVQPETDRCWWGKRRYRGVAGG